MKPFERKSKYGNHKVEDGGHIYDSKREHRRHKELQLMEKAGEISNIRRQVVFELVPGVRILNERARPAIKYVADFVYTRNGREVVEDSKGMRTPYYKLKRHLMKALRGIDVEET